MNMFFPDTTFVAFAYSMYVFIASFSTIMAFFNACSTSILFLLFHLLNRQDPAGYYRLVMISVMNFLLRCQHNSRRFMCQWRFEVLSPPLTENVRSPIIETCQEC